MTIKPQAVIRVQFLPPSAGGRELPLVAKNYGCPVLVEGKGFDCRFVLSEEMKFEFGQTYSIGVRFLSPKKALEALCVGQEIELWEGKVIAKGSVEAIMD